MGWLGGWNWALGWTGPFHRSTVILNSYTQRGRSGRDRMSKSIRLIVSDHPIYTHRSHAPINTQRAWSRASRRWRRCFRITSCRENSTTRGTTVRTCCCALLGLFGQVDDKMLWMVFTVVFPATPIETPRASHIIEKIDRLLPSMILKTPQRSSSGRRSI